MGPGPVQGQGLVEPRSSRMWDNVFYIVAAVLVVGLLFGWGFLWKRGKDKNKAQNTQG